MKRRLPLCACLLFCVAIGHCLARNVYAGPFGLGDLAVFQADSASANNSTFTIVDLNSSTANQTPLNSIAIEGGTGANALRTSGSATSTGYLARSNDKTLLTFTGHNSTTTGVNANTLLPRGVGSLNATGTFALQTTYTGASGNQTRAATSLNNTDWFVGDQGGLYTNGASTANPTANLRSIKSFGGSVYTLQQSSTATTIVVNSVTGTPSAATITGLPGLTNNASAQDFYLVSSGSNGSAFDELYLTTNTSATVGSILKFSLVSGTWTANGSFTTTFGGFGLAAAKDGAGADLFVSTGAGATAGNSVLKLLDSAGFNQTINLGAATTLYTAPAAATVKGVELAPIAVPEPATFVLAGLGGLLLTQSLPRRKN